VLAAAHRLAMTRLAVRGNPGFAVSTIELAARGPSYTVDTVRRFAAGGDAALYVLIGADSLDEFHTWHEPEAILGLARLAVAGRPGAGARARGWAARTRRVTWIGNPGLELSSSLIRAHARAGRSLRYLVPEAVANYIARHGLYAPRARRGGRPA
jgi:nicotinate-nucleotide adenylyltransferase